MHVDSRALLRRAIAQWLADAPGFVLVAQAATRAEALAGLDAKPEVVLLNPSVDPTGEGALICELVERQEGLAILLVCSSIYPLDVRLCGERGVRGCVADTCDSAELGLAVRQVSAGGEYWSEECLRWRALFERLRRRERRKSTPVRRRPDASETTSAVVA